MEQADFYYEIERTGGWLRGVTYRDSLLFEFIVHPSFFTQATDILSRLFLENQWTHEDIRREKEVVYREIENRFSGAYQRLLLDFFEQKPQGDAISGTKNKVKRLSRPQLLEWKRKLFSTHHTTLFIAGEISPANLHYAQEKFSQIPTGTANEWPSFAPESFLHRSAKHDQYDSEDGTYLQIALSFDIDRSQVSFMAAEMLESTLCNGLYAPFTLRLRE